MRLKSMAAGVAAFVCAAAGQAQAAGIPADALQAMRELNIIVLGDMSAGHSIEGKTFVGGNLTGSTTFGTGNSSQGLAPSSRATLTVVGEAKDAGNLMINSGSNGGVGNLTPEGLVVGGSVASANLNAQNATVKVGGALNGNMSNGSTVQVGGAFTGNANGAAVASNLGAGFTSSLQSGLIAEKEKLAADLTALSSTLSGLTVTTLSQITATGQGWKFNAVDGGSGFALFDIDADVLLANEFSFAGSLIPIVVNVRGANQADGNVVWNAKGVGGFNDDLNPWIIWNFVNEGLKPNDPSDPFRLIIQNDDKHGSILAAHAAVSNSGARIEGTLVAKTFNQGAQVHLGTFKGDDVFGVPEPSTWAMMIMGFGAAGAALRRRRAFAA